MPSRTPDDASDLLLEWRVHLVRRAPRKLVGVGAALLLVGLVAFWVYPHPVFVLAVCGVLVAAVADYLFPQRFRLTREEAASYSLLAVRKLPWTRVRRVYETPEGVKLSPLRRPTRLEAFRGVFLWFGDNREAVMEVIHTQTGEKAPAVKEESAAPQPKKGRNSARTRRKRSRSRR